MANDYEKWSSHPGNWTARVNSYLKGMTLADMPSPYVHSFSTGAAHQGDHQQSKHHHHRECHLKISMLASWMLAIRRAIFRTVIHVIYGPSFLRLIESAAKRLRLWSFQRLNLNFMRAAFISLWMFPVSSTRTAFMASKHDQIIWNWKKDQHDSHIYIVDQWTSFSLTQSLLPPLRPPFQKYPMSKLWPPCCYTQGRAKFACLQASSGAGFAHVASTVPWMGIISIRICIYWSNQSCNILYSYR